MLNFASMKGRSRPAAQIVATAFAVALFAAQAPAWASDSAVIQISGEVAPRCAFTSTPTQGDVGELETGTAEAIGTLGFTCNLANSGAVSLTIQSQNGALRRDGGAETIAYEAAWDVQGRGGDFGNAANWTSPTGFSLQSGANGVEQVGTYFIRVTGPTQAAPAGVYRDTITYTITP